jgi:FKBP-type peptidyl-prolyl cis-trans isomerase (trigger factor)
MQSFTTNKIVAWCSIAVFVLTTVSVSTAPAQDDPAIEVGSETMDASTVQQRIDQQMQKMEQRFGKKFKKKPNLKKKLREKTKKQVVDQIVDQLVMLTHAKKSGISVEQDEIDQTLEEFKNQQPGDQSLQKMLEQSGMSEKQLTERIRQSILVNKYTKQEIGEVSVSTEEARQFYDENSKRFKNRSFGDIKDRIVQMLEQRKKQKQAQNLVSRLKEKTEINIRI